MAVAAAEQPSWQIKSTSAALIHFVEVGRALVNAIGIGESEDGKALGSAFTLDRCFEGIIGFAVSVRRQQVTAMFLAKAPLSPLSIPSHLL
jgi:hypothetical protein